MSICTQLQINASWRMEGVADLLKSFGVKDFKFHPTHTVDYIVATFEFDGDERMLSIHPHYKTPLGSCTLLSLGHNDNAIKLFKMIANQIGGYFIENDCDDKCEMIAGQTNNSSGIPYFFEYGIINHNLNQNNLTGLKETIKIWTERIGSNNLY